MPVSSSAGSAPQFVQAAVTQDSTVHGPATVITSWPGGSGQSGSRGCPPVSGGGWSSVIAGCSFGVARSRDCSVPGVAAALPEDVGAFFGGGSAPGAELLAFRQR